MQPVSELVVAAIGATAVGVPVGLDDPHPTISDRVPRITTAHTSFVFILFNIITSNVLFNFISFKKLSSMNAEDVAKLLFNKVTNSQIRRRAMSNCNANMN
jgi:hypothetical protein